MKRNSSDQHPTYRDLGFKPGFSISSIQVPGSYSKVTKDKGKNSKSNGSYFFLAAIRLKTLHSEAALFPWWRFFACVFPLRLAGRHEGTPCDYFQMHPHPSVAFLESTSISFSIAGTTEEMLTSCQPESEDKNMPCQTRSNQFSNSNEHEVKNGPGTKVFAGDNKFWAHAVKVPAVPQTFKLCA